MIRKVAVALSIACMPAFAHAEDAEALLKKVAAAMGASDVQTLRYSAEGTGYTFGQAYVPGGAWPKIQVHSQIRTINYETGSMREQFTLSRAEPRGGGGYPLSGQQVNDWYVSNGYAWNVIGGNAAPGPRYVGERTHQLWITPVGVIRAALKNKAVAKFDDKGGATVSFTDPGLFTAVAHVNKDYLIDRVDSRAPDPVMGEADMVTVYSNYHDIGGMKYPARVRQAQGGYPVLDVVVLEVERNVPADITVPDNVKAAGERVAAEKVADGVWFFGGGSHNSVLIEMSDHVVLVESPLNDARAAAVIDKVKELVPGKPIRYLVNSHHHFDHSGGVRAAVAEGAILVTQAQNKPYFEKLLATPVTIAPDRLGQSKRKAEVLGVREQMTMSDGHRTLEIYRLGNNPHTETFLGVYLPREKILIEADLYTPLPPNAQPPASPNPYNVSLIETLERLKLAPEKILPLHGRVVPASELYTTAGMTPK